MLTIVVLTAVFVLAYANGANDNFKGVATLFGSGTTNYRCALVWATLATFLGSVTAIIWSQTLLKNFSGRGLVADDLVAQPTFVAAVATAAGLTVLLATTIGMPISTTHSLVGALVGAAWAAGSGIHLEALITNFLAPLLLSPFIAILATSVGYSVLHLLRRRVGVTEETCFCLGAEPIEVVPAMSPAAALQRTEHLTLSTGTAVTCRNRYQGAVLGVEASWLLDRLHFLSAGSVSFARGLNDTPKIAALLLVAPQIGGVGGMVAVAALIALGGAVSARKVALVMSRKITPMNHGQGCTANLVTGLLVIGASRFGLPVSTTHVSCGALIGIGTVSRHARWSTIGQILVAWVTTLPAAAALAAGSHWVLSTLA